MLGALAFLHNGRRERKKRAEEINEHRARKTKRKELEKKQIEIDR